MELQSPFQFQSHSNLIPQFNPNQITPYHIQDNQLQSIILSLVQRNIPVFVFEYQNNQQEQENEKNITEVNKQSFLKEKILTYNRKAKSLEELSKKFIDHFQGRGNNIIELDKITIQLGVQRRRIYDIINILESLNVVRKKGKNNYEWKGLHEAVRTIHLCSNQTDQFKIQNFKKEKSLEYLASGFLKLFINWKPAISLEEAAKEMMKDMQEASIKTKIRRLYDIINVFRSLGLVRRATLSSKKPGYEWAGTDYLECLIMKKQESDENTRVNELNSFEEVQNAEERPSPVAYSKRTYFSPLICPLLQKPETLYLKQMFQTKEKQRSVSQQLWKTDSNQQFRLQNSDFPIFHRSTSAFSLVNMEEKEFQ